MTRLREIARCFDPRKGLRVLVTRSDDRQPFLDGLRALSILAVIVHHSVNSFRTYNKQLFKTIHDTPLTHLAYNGEMGVDIFFVLSGFLIGGMLLRELTRDGSVDRTRFYLRRALRILPVYYALLLILIVLEQWSPSFYIGGAGRQCSNVAWANALFINNIVIKPGCVGWSWSLSIEEQFYLFAPALLLVLRGRRLVGGLWVMLAIAVGFRIHAGFAVYDAPKDIDTIVAAYVRPWNRFGALLCGVLVAALAARTSVNSERHRWSARLAVWGGLALAAAMFIPLSTPITPRPGELHWFIAQRYLFAAGIGFAIWGMLHYPGSLVGRLLSARFWFPIAQLSYAIYLVNNIVFNEIYARWTPETIAGWLLLALPLALAICLVVSSILFITIEQPFMRMRSVFHRTRT